MRGCLPEANLCISFLSMTAIGYHAHFFLTPSLMWRIPPLRGISRGSPNSLGLGELIWAFNIKTPPAAVAFEDLRSMPKR